MTDHAQLNDGTGSRKRRPTWRDLLPAFAALYQTVRGYIMPLLIACLVVDLGFLTNAITDVAALGYPKGAHDAHDLHAAGLYSLMSACTTGLVYIVIGMCFCAMRTAFLCSRDSGPRTPRR